MLLARRNFLFRLIFSNEILLIIYANEPQVFCCGVTAKCISSLQFCFSLGRKNKEGFDQSCQLGLHIWRPVSKAAALRINTGSLCEINLLRACQWWPRYTGEDVSPVLQKILVCQSHGWSTPGKKPGNTNKEPLEVTEATVTNSKSWTFYLSVFQMQTSAVLYWLYC